jgi:hypothetical protein
MVKGLSFRKTADALAAFVKEHGATGPRRAVLCTYDLQPDRFEAVVLPELTRRRRWFRTLVLADGAALQRAGVLDQRSAEPIYELAPVRLRGPGVFHPKLIVLQAGERLLVGVGSANLTPGGLGGNLELMLFASDASTAGRELAESAIQFLDDLRHARAVMLPDSARRFLERICVSRPRKREGVVLHNLDEPLIAQMSHQRPSRVERTALVSPWHSSLASPEGVEAPVLMAIGRALGARPVVHTEGANGKGPGLGKHVRVRVLKATTIDSGEDLDTDGADSDDVPQRPRRPATLHAKAYIAVGRNAATLWFGSANCTTPALLESAKGRGNVELLVRTGLGPSALAALEADLASMFEERRGVLPPKAKARMEAPRGCVLSGYVSSWAARPSLTLELVPAARARLIRIARSADRARPVELTIPRGATAVVVQAATVTTLVDQAAIPPVLWEYVETTAVPFPVSVPCVSNTDVAEQILQDLLDDLAGRVPAAFSSGVPRVQPDDDNSGEEDEEDQDRELDLLTTTEHQGSLDRLAVRVELLRRRLAVAWTPPESRVHYRGVIEKLEIAPVLRRTLLAHLGTAGRAR